MILSFIGSLSTKLKKLLFRIIVSAFVFVFALILRAYENFVVFLFICSFLIVGHDILLKSFKNIKNLQIFDENFLMTIATFGAIALGEYHEAVAIMLFYQTGEFFQMYAVNRSKKSIVDLMNIRPDYANIEYNGKLKKVSPEKISVGDIIVIKPGEKVPLDGIVIDGISSIDTSALSGESIPKDVDIGDEVLSGCINISGILKIKVTKVFSESTISKIIDLVENASSKKANVENFITRFARYYTPFIVGISILTALLPPLLFNQEFSKWAYRSVVFLVISCPCALVISVPLSFFSGLGAASKNGILIKGSNYLEALSHAKYFVFDKTGTITRGNFEVVLIEPLSISKEKLLEITAYSEVYSNHPIAQSVKNRYGKDINLSRIKNIREFHGMGIEANVDDKIVYVGNLKLMKEINIVPNKVEDIGTIIYVVIDGKYAGYLVIADEIKEDSFKALKALNSLGIKKIVMLTGDRKEIAEHIAKKICIGNVCSELLPADKVGKIEELLAEKLPNEKLVFIGDGVNDAPVLARADIGIAMGSMGSDSAIEASDIVIMSDELSKIGIAIDISKKTIKIVKQNIVFALSTKFIILALGLFGYTSIWFAVFADVGVMILAVLNSIRMLFYKKYNAEK